MLTNRQLFLTYQAQTSSTPLMLEIERAEGVYMFTTKGEKIIDLISGIGVSNVGHRNEKVMTAIQNQLEKYMHLMVYGELIQSPQVILAKALSDTFEGRLNSVYFVNSGSEAVEGALKLAKRFTKRQEIVYFNHSYHGSSHGALSVMGNEYFKQAYRPLLPCTRMLDFGVIDQLCHISNETACVIVEAIQGEAGVIVPTADYMQQLQHRCHEVGALLIIDEIQSGFGRTGKFWAHEHFCINPDIVVCAKGMGGGMPIGAFIAKKEVMDTFSHQPVLGHITTFGGHPVCCAASIAVIDYIKSENILDTVATKEKLFRMYLTHPAIRSIRSIGLMMAVEFESYDFLKAVIDLAIEKGVLTDWFLHCNNSMRIAPPLTISEDEIKEACAIIVVCIEEVYKAYSKTTV
jgi:acetylornithine/succinyldiaminopimelate/putrescine aminotransferase